jgi:hypothetical protein
MVATNGASKGRYGASRRQNLRVDIFGGIRWILCVVHRSTQASRRAKGNEQKSNIALSCARKEEAASLIWIGRAGNSLRKDDTLDEGTRTSHVISLYLQ